MEEFHDCKSTTFIIPSPVIVFHSHFNFVRQCTFCFLQSLLAEILSQSNWSMQWQARNNNDDLPVVCSLQFHCQDLTRNIAGWSMQMNTVSRQSAHIILESSLCLRASKTWYVLSHFVRDVKERVMRILVRGILGCA